MRFEIVSAPIEEQLQNRLRTQISTLLSGTQGILSRANAERTRLHSTLSDEAFVTRIATVSATLLMPSSLPGALLVFAFVLKLSRYVLVRLFARRAVRRAASLRQAARIKTS